MATTYRYVVYDLLKDLKKVFDDKDISLRSVLYWVTINANRLKYLHITKSVNDKSWISGSFLSIFTGIPVKTVPNDINPNLVENRKFIEAPVGIMDLERENGIHYISYDIAATGCCNQPPFTMVQFSPTTPAQSRLLYMNKYTSPSPNNPYFYRVGNYIYLLGIECINVKELEIGLYSYGDPKTICNLDEEIGIPEHLIPVLKASVLNMGVYAMKIPGDRKNEGTDTSVTPSNKTTTTTDTTDTTTDNTTE